jgi:hypothetical protein
MIPMADSDGYRAAMVGTLSFYDHAGERQHSIYTEAACKSLVKQRLCASGMRWKSTGATIVLSLRALARTVGRWAQFWQKIDQFGAECCC